MLAATRNLAVDSNSKGKQRAEKLHWQGDKRRKAYVLVYRGSGLHERQFLESRRRNPDETIAW